MMHWGQILLVVCLASYAMSQPIDESREKRSPVAGRMLIRSGALTAGCGRSCRQEAEPVDDVQSEEAPVEDAPEEEAEVPRVSKAQKPAEDEDDDVADRKASRGPTYTNFFPMMFGGGGASGESGEGGRRPGGSTAVANSFSSGKGAIANSHAQAFGSAATPDQYKSAPSRYRA